MHGHRRYHDDQTGRLNFFATHFKGTDVGARTENPAISVLQRAKDASRPSAVAVPHAFDHRKI
jgi:hypothetical protein